MAGWVGGGEGEGSGRRHGIRVARGAARQASSSSRAKVAGVRGCGRAGGRAGGAAAHRGTATRRSRRWSRGSAGAAGAWSACCTPAHARPGVASRVSAPGQQRRLCTRAQNARRSAEPCARSCCHLCMQQSPCMCASSCRTLESLYALAPSNSPPLIMEELRPSRPVVRPRRSPRSACSVVRKCINGCVTQAGRAAAHRARMAAQRTVGARARRAARTLGGTLPASVLVLPVMEPTMMQRGAPAGLFLGELFRSSSSRLTSRKWPRWLVLRADRRGMRVAAEAE